MRKDRLELCIKALEKASPENFYMGVYTNSCGTPACILGHLACMPNQDLLELGDQSIMYQAHVPGAGGMCADYYDDLIGAWFDISRDHVEALFCGEGCGNAKTPAEAIAFLREYINTNGANVVES